MSGHFADGEDARRARADELYEACGLRLAFMTAEHLGAAVRQLTQVPSLRNALPWRALLSRLDVTAASIADAVETARRDGLMQA